ncbi:MAG: hypothetical protein QXX03_05785 [Nitrososphaerota archaeon]
MKTYRLIFLKSITHFDCNFKIGFSRERKIEKRRKKFIVFEEVWVKKEDDFQLDEHTYKRVIEIIDASEEAIVAHYDVKTSCNPYAEYLVFERLPDRKVLFSLLYHPIYLNYPERREKIHEILDLVKSKDTISDEDISHFLQSVKVLE